jgi:hypothetical protein
VSLNPAWAAHSEAINEILSAYTEAWAELGNVGKDSTADAGTYSYKYADLAATLDVVRPILAAHGLAVMQPPTIENRMVQVWTTLVHTSGQWITFLPLELPAGTTAQQAGSGMTYARRYALTADLGLATDDDDGANAAPRDTPQSGPSDFDVAAARALYKRIADGSAVVKAAARDEAHEHDMKVTETNLYDPSFRALIAEAVASAEPGPEPTGARCNCGDAVLTDVEPVKEHDGIIHRRDAPCTLTADGTPEPEGTLL